MKVLQIVMSDTGDDVGQIPALLKRFYVMSPTRPANTPAVYVFAGHRKSESDLICVVELRILGFITRNAECRLQLFCHKDCLLPVHHVDYVCAEGEMRDRGCTAHSRGA